MRPIGSALAQFDSSVPPKATIGVSIPPGWTEFTRTPIRPRSRAAVLERPRTAHLLDTYAAADGSPTMPALDEMLMIDPPPPRFMDGATDFIPIIVPTRLTSITR